MKHFFTLLFVLSCTSYSFSQIIDTTLYVNYTYCIGNSVEVHPVSPPQAICTYLWTPNIGVSNPSIAEPIIQAPVTTIYERRAICGTDTTFNYVVITVKPVIALGYNPLLLPDTTLLCQNIGACVDLHIPNVLQQPFNNPVIPFSTLYAGGYTSFLWTVTGDTDTITTACQGGLYKVYAVYPTDTFCNTQLAQTFVKVVLDCNAIGVEETVKSHPIIYPNPIRDILYVENITDGNWFLYSLTSKLVDSGKIIANCEISMRYLPQGMYILQIENKHKVDSYKIIKD